MDSKGNQLVKKRLLKFWVVLGLYGLPTGSATGGRSGGADGLGIAEGRRARGRVAGRALEGAVAPCSSVLLLLLDLAAAHLPPSWIWVGAGG